MLLMLSSFTLFMFSILMLSMVFSFFSTMNFILSIDNYSTSVYSMSTSSLLKW